MKPSDSAAQVAQMFFIMAVVILAPHIPLEDAKWLSITCLVIAITFGVSSWIVP